MRGQRIAGDRHRLGEVLLGRVHVAAAELILVREGDGVDEKVDAAPFFLDRREHRIQRGGIGDVAGQNEFRPGVRSQRIDPLFQRIALIGKCDFGALADDGLGDAPSDRAIVGDTKNDATLARHEISTVRHKPSINGSEGLLYTGLAPPKVLSPSRKGQPGAVGLGVSSR